MSTAHEMIYLFKYWLDGPICLVVAVFGILINILAIIMMGKKKVSKTFHLLMINLSLWDLLYLILSVICFAMPALSLEYRQHFYIHILAYSIPLANICLYGSCYSTVALTIERYIMLCRPFFRLKYKIRASSFIIPILLTAPLYTLPRFFEVESYNNNTYVCSTNSSYWFVDSSINEAVLNSLNNRSSIEYANSTTVINHGLDYEPENETESSYDYYPVIIFNEKEFLSLNETERKEHCLSWKVTTNTVVQLSQLRKNPAYVLWYVNFINLLVNLILPTTLLGILNYFVYKVLSRNQVQAKELRRATVVKEDKLRKRDVRLTRISITIVGVFICCHLPRFIPNIIEIIVTKPPEWVNALVSINNLLQVINSAVNYVIYFCHCYKTNAASHHSEVFEVDLRSINNRNNGGNNNGHNNGGHVGNVVRNQARYKVTMI